MTAPQLGLHPSMPMADYLQIPGLGSTELEWLAVSPRYYRYMRGRERRQTAAMALGTAVHAAVLEPEAFARDYAREPDPEVVAPELTKPRASRQFREAVATLAGNGFTVLRGDDSEAVHAMAAAVREHPHAALLLERAPQREVTMLWERAGRLCRGRVDLLGPHVIGDLKTTRNLRSFSPWTITRMGYHRQLGYYADGLERLGLAVEHFFLIAVETSPPFDVGVFAVQPETVRIGQLEVEALFERLHACEDSGEWPGMFPNIEVGALSDAAVAAMSEEE